MRLEPATSHIQVYTITATPINLIGKVKLCQKTIKDGISLWSLAKPEDKRPGIHLFVTTDPVALSTVTV